VRLVGVLTVMAGLVHQARGLPLLEGIPAWFGYVLIEVGLVKTF